MTVRAEGRAIGAALLMFAIANTADAQPAAGDSYGSAGRVSFGAETSLVVGRRDGSAFFNYTDYQHNALRLARLRLMGEWRATTRLAVVGEVRSEDADGVGVPALYVRWRPFGAHDLSVQAGRVPPVIGAFPRRAYGHDNVVIGFPLAYQYLTSLRPDALPASVDELLGMRARGWQPSYSIGVSSDRPGLPLVSAFRWDTGVEASWRRAPVQLAFAVTRGAPSRSPALDEPSAGLGWSARASTQTNFGAVVGVSAASGQWIDCAVRDLATGGAPLPTSQRLVGADGEYGRGRWLVRGEWLRSTFNVPMAATPTASTSLNAWSAFVEGRYRLRPRWQLAGRVEALRFGLVAGEVTGRVRSWDAGVDRVEAALSFRVVRQAQIKAAWQHDWRDGGRVRARGFPAVEFLYWF